MGLIGVIAGVFGVKGLVVVKFDVAAVFGARRTTMRRLGGESAGFSLVATCRATGIARSSVAIAASATATTAAAASFLGTTGFAVVGALASQRFGVGLGERRRLALVGEGSDVEFFLIAASVAGFLCGARRLTRRTIAA